MQLTNYRTSLDKAGLLASRVARFLGATYTKFIPNLKTDI